jgi:hypothetical protein
MCWSLPVAASFASVESLIILSMYLRTRWSFFTADSTLFTPESIQVIRRKDNFILPMLLTINIVEWSETAIWATGPVDRNALGDAPCNKVNHVFTALCGWVVMLQPSFVMLFARFTGPEEERSWFTIPLFLAAMTTIGWFIRFSLGEAGVALIKSREKMALAWTQTCSFHNAGHRHLEWRFALADIIVLPTMFSYHLFFNFALMFHDFPVGFMAAFGSVITLIVQFASLDGDGEAWSVWCWSGMLFICYYWVVNLFAIVPGTQSWVAWARTTGNLSSFPRTAQAAEEFDSAEEAAASAHSGGGAAPNQPLDLGGDVPLGMTAA